MLNQAHFSQDMFPEASALWKYTLFGLRDSDRLPSGPHTGEPSEKNRSLRIKFMFSLLPFL